MMARSLYRVLLWLLFPLAFLYLLKRSRKQPEYRQHWGERLGFYPPRATKTAQTIWVHAVSVGEMRACAALVKALKTQFPDASLLLTCMTPTGRATARELFGADAEIAFLPYDYPSAVRRFLRHYQPRLGLLMETEIWPNLIHACADQSIPLVLGNARLSQKSLRGYLRVKSLIAPALSRLSGVLAQSTADAERLRQLGAIAPEVMGNIKFDNLPPVELVDRGLGWKAALAGRPTMLWASTREGEEAILLDALSAAGWPQNLLLLLVPRHPQRFNEVADLLAARNLKTQRRSNWDGNALAGDVQVLLGDSMGEMNAWYALADVVLMGGSVLPYGCQNMIEASAVGAPVLLGPSVFNFAQAAELSLACGAARQYPDAPSMIAQALQLLGDAAARAQMGQAGMQFAADHRGATQRMLDYLARHAPN